MAIFRIDLNGWENPSLHVLSEFLQENHRNTPPEIYTISEVFLPQDQLWKVYFSHLLDKNMFLECIWGVGISKTPNSRRKDILDFSSNLRKVASSRGKYIPLGKVTFPIYRPSSPDRLRRAAGISNDVPLNEDAQSSAGQRPRMGLHIQSVDMLHDFATSGALPSDTLKGRVLEAS